MSLSIVNVAAIGVDKIMEVIHDRPDLMEQLKHEELEEVPSRPAPPRPIRPSAYLSVRSSIPSFVHPPVHPPIYPPIDPQHRCWGGRL